MKGGFLNMLMMKDSDGKISFGAVFLVYLFPLLTVYVFYLVMRSSFETEEDIQKRIQSMNDRNEYTKQQLLEIVRSRNKNHKRPRSSHKKWD